MSKNIVVVYHSGYGHTAKVAESVAAGAAKVQGCKVDLISVDALEDAEWAKLDAAHAIIFGCPTYMGSASSKFKEFFEKASGRWFEQKWKDKIAAGFTNSKSMSGDKQNTIHDIFANAMQHSMVWVSLGILPGRADASGTVPTTALNRVGSYSGLMTQANDDKPEVTPPSGDHETARQFGERVAKMTLRFN